MPINDFRAVVLPYCLKLEPCGRYAILNRNYKPVGFLLTGYTRYADYPVLATVDVTHAIARKASIHADDDIRAIYLYDDATNPLTGAHNFSNYCQRLNSLLKLKMHGFDGAGQGGDLSAEAMAIRQKCLNRAKKYPQ